MVDKDKFRKRCAVLKKINSECPAYPTVKVMVIDREGTMDVFYKCIIIHGSRLI
jgi:hypothetical protein